MARNLVRLCTEWFLPEVAAVAIFLIVLWFSIFTAISREHDVAVVKAAQTAANLARAFEEGTRGTVGQIDQVLQSARGFRAAQGERFDFDEWARTQTLPSKLAATITMADQTGRVIGATRPVAASTRIDAEPYFRAQFDPTHDELYISQPVFTRGNSQAMIHFTRKLLGPRGDFAGVAVFSLGSVELSQLYQTLDLGKGFVSLLAPDGTLLARGPLKPDEIGQRISENPALQTRFVDSNGVVRIGGTRTADEAVLSFRRLQEYPLIVMVEFDGESVFENFWALRMRIILEGIVATLAIGLIGMLWIEQKRRSIASRRALNVTLETISQGIVMVDARGNVPVINPRARDLLAVPDAPPEIGEKLAASRALDLAARHAAAATQPDASELASASEAGKQFDVAREDGTVIEVRSHNLPDGGFVHSYTDVTRERIADARVRYLAHYDELTGLGNRFHLRRRIAEYLPRRSDPLQMTAFMLIDLDGFKGINDTLGHEVGDELLVEIARRLQIMVREDDFVARIGGDEFVVLQTELYDADAAAALAQQVLLRLAEPIQVAGQHVRVGASIGIAFHPKDGVDGDALFKHADIALYSAKAAGRGTFRFFDADMTRLVNENRLLESGLRWALENEALEVHYQPKFACNTLAIVGFEALVRWRHPVRGAVSPETFIRVAEECGLIKRLGLWVIEQACTTAAAWRTPQPVAVNVSLLQLQDTELQEGIAEILKRTGLAANMLELEVTESVMADNNQVVLDTLLALKSMGISIALDDFGTGYSSLSYLRRFSFDKIKIDKSFVQGQAHDQGVRVILEAILGMCHQLGLAVVGEGVETRQQLTMLRRYGCNEVQGYLLGCPLTADAVDSFVEKNERELAQESGLVAAAREFELTP